MTTVSIGRHSDCGIVLSHPSVSRHHAELAFGANNEMKLVDTNSKYGTYIRRSGSSEWRKIAVSELNPSDCVRFGRFEIEVSELISSLPRRKSPAGKIAAKDIDASPVERNPETGEIVNRRTR